MFEICWSAPCGSSVCNPLESATLELLSATFELFPNLESATLELLSATFELFSKLQSSVHAFQRRSCPRSYVRCVRRRRQPGCRPGRYHPRWPGRHLRDLPSGVQGGTSHPLCPGRRTGRRHQVPHGLHRAGAQGGGQALHHAVRHRRRLLPLHPGQPPRRPGEAPRGSCRGRDGGAAGVPHLPRCGPPRRPRGRGQGKGKGQGQGRRQRQRQGPRQGGRRP